MKLFFSLVYQCLCTYLSWCARCWHLALIITIRWWAGFFHCQNTGKQSHIPFLAVVSLIQVDFIEHSWQGLFISLGQVPSSLWQAKTFIRQWRIEAEHHQKRGTMTWINTTAHDSQTLICPPLQAVTRFSLKSWNMYISFEYKNVARMWLNLPYVYTEGKSNYNTYTHTPHHRFHTCLFPYCIALNSRIAGIVLGH